MTMLTSAAMCNARRVWRFKQSQLAAKNTQTVALSSQSQRLSPSILAIALFCSPILRVRRYFVSSRILGHYCFA